MKAWRIVLFCLWFGPGLFGQGSDTLWLWPGQVPGETAEKKLPVITPNHSGDVVRLTDVTDPMLVVFEPKQESKNGAAVIICPGGGYQILAIDKEGYEIACWLKENGYTAFVLQYRVPGNRKGALQDVQRAMRIVRSQSNRRGLDVGKIGILGFSAGGHLAATVSNSTGQAAYDPMDEADSLDFRPDFTVLIYPAYLDQGEDQHLSPELEISELSPPSFIFATADDPHANSALVMAKALRDGGHLPEFHLLSNGGHGYGMRKGNIATETWPVWALEWMSGFTNP